MTWIDLVGWIAAALTLAAYSMRTMLPLRITAIAANVFFASYGWLTDIMPTLVLHLLLFPFNLYRLFEILRNTRRLRAARHAPADFSWLGKLTKPVDYASGTVVFSRGASPDSLYYLDRGEVLLEEIDVTLKAGDIFGEIAFFTEAKARTVSARCVSDCKIVAIDEAKFMSLYYQNPTFGFAVAQLIAKRLMDGFEKSPETYLALRQVGDASGKPDQRF